MPVVVRTRPFDADFYRAVSLNGDIEDTPKARRQRAEKAAQELFG
jgi:hypothetical protein